MKKNRSQNIVIIGCGNVAWHLASHLQSLKDYTVSVYNHQKNPALSDFKTKLKCAVAVGLDKVTPDADLYFICVADSYIAEVASQLTIRNRNAIVMHTSGSARRKELGKQLPNTAVFYPLQTFSKSDTILWTEIPVLIEASSKAAEAKLLKLAQQFTKTPRVLGYKERLTLHLGAVMVNNFTNALYVAASDVVSEANKNDFKLLLPMIRQTTQKLDRLDPRAAQTGPAKRNDTVVLKKHLQLLSAHSDLKKLYKQLSRLIAHQQKNNHA